MRVALVTTTVNVPEVLRLYRSLREDVHIVITGDERTPHERVHELVRDLGSATYLDKCQQERLGYSCSPLLAWNTIARRNVAVLEALKLRPDIIVTIDDDNLPLTPRYFDDFEATFQAEFRGVCATGSEENWFNVGSLLSPQVFHRGYPHELRGKANVPRMRGIAGARVGISAGLWAGDPDVDAMERMVTQPTVYHWSSMVENGLVIEKDCYAPFNSQNTAFRYEVAPLMMVWPGVGRFDDIWASYAAERVLRDTQYYVHFGRPMVWQQRNAQSCWRNLRDELHGMEHTLELVRALERIDVGDGSPVARLRRCFSGLRGTELVPEITIRAGLAWCEDVERVMG